MTTPEDDAGQAVRSNPLLCLSVRQPMAWLVGAVLIAAIVFGWLAGRKK